jgi:hypothetical protein
MIYFERLAPVKDTRRWARQEAGRPDAAGAARP